MKWKRCLGCTQKEELEEAEQLVQSETPFVATCVVWQATENVEQKN